MEKEKPGLYFSLQKPISCSRIGSRSGCDCPGNFVSPANGARKCCITNAELTNHWHFWAWTPKIPQNAFISNSIIYSRGVQPSPGYSPRISRRSGWFYSHFADWEMRKGELRRFSLRTLNWRQILQLRFALLSWNRGCCPGHNLIWLFPWEPVQLQMCRRDLSLKQSD